MGFTEYLPLKKQSLRHARRLLAEQGFLARHPRMLDILARRGYPLEGEVVRVPEGRIGELLETVPKRAGAALPTKGATYVGCLANQIYDADSDRVRYPTRQDLDNATVVGLCTPGVAGVSPLFEICVMEKNVRRLKRVVPPAAPRSRYLRLQLSGAGIKEAVLQFPTFFQHFDGVKVDWTWLRDGDADRLRVERGWLDQQKLSVLVDFTSGCNHYPDISFLDLNRDRWRESRARFAGVIDRMTLLGSRAAVMCLHGLSEEENYLMLDATEPRYRANVAEICAYAAERGITLYLQSHPNKRHPQSTDMLRFIAAVGAPNLRYALNTAHTLLAGEALHDALMMAANRVAMVLLSAPERDLFGHGYDAHRAVAGAAMRLPSLKALGMPVVFDARYSSWSEIYRDVKTWDQLESTSCQRITHHTHPNGAPETRSGACR